MTVRSNGSFQRIPTVFQRVPTVCVPTPLYPQPLEGTADRWNGLFRPTWQGAATAALGWIALSGLSTCPRGQQRYSARATFPIFCLTGRRKA